MISFILFPAAPLRLLSFLLLPLLAHGFTNCVVLSCPLGYTFSWSIDTAGGVLLGELSAPASGWLGFGLSADSTMVSSSSAQGSDMWVGSAAMPGSPPASLRDYSASSYATPLLDASQDVTLLSSTYVGGVMTLQFSRPLVTADTAFDRPITPGSPQPVVWALAPGMASMPSADGASFGAHAADGAGTMLLDFSAPSDCSSCNPGLVNASATSAAQKARCGSNGWTPREHAPGRDGGAAAPRRLVNMTRTYTVMTRVPVAPQSASSVATPSPSPVVDVGVTPSPTPQQQGGSTPSPFPAAVNNATLLALLLNPAAPSTPALLRPAGGQFSATWLLDEASQLLLFALSAPAGGWVGIGFNQPAPGTGKCKMALADMIHGWATPRAGAATCLGLTGPSGCDVFLSDGQVLVKDAHPTADAVQNLRVFHASVVDGVQTVLFARPAFTGDASDENLSPGRTSFVLWAYGSTILNPLSGLVGAHSKQGRGCTSGPVDVGQLGAQALGSGAVPPPTSGAFDTKPYTLHAVSMVLGYWVFMSLGALLPRFRPLVPLLAAGGTTTVRPMPFHAKHVWFVGHVYSMALGTLCVIIGFIAVLVAQNGNGSDWTWGPHTLAGTLSLASLVVQFGLGLARPAPDSPLRSTWHAAHALGAVGTLLSGSVAILLGLKKVGAGGAALAAGILHVLCFAALYIFSGLAAQVTASTSAPPRKRAFKLSSSGGVSEWQTPSGRAEEAEGGAPDEPPTSTNPLAAGGGGGGKHRAPASVASPAGGAPPKRGSSAVSTLVLCVGGPFLLCCAVGVVSVLLRDTTNAGGVPEQQRRALRAAEEAAGYDGRALQEYVEVNITITNSSMEWQAWEEASWPGGDGVYCAHANATVVPPTETSYLCRGFAMPVGDLWALEMEPIVDRSDVLHHMLVYTTWADVTDLAAQGNVDLGGGVWDCLGGTGTILGPVYVWAVGGGPASYPPGTGYRVGLPTAEAAAGARADTAGVPFVMIQYHYSNPTMAAGITDSSGVLMRLTDTPQPVDVGMTWLGANVPGGISIPPGKSGYGFRTTLPSLFSQPASSVNPLTSQYTVFGSFLHAHLLGTRVWAEQTRGGNRVLVGGVDGLGHADNYDFNHQTIVPVSTLVQPGDGVSVHCVFHNTVSYGLRVGNTLAAAGQTVVGGERTVDEMCMVFLYYTPRVPGQSIVQLAGATPFCDDSQSDGLRTCTSYQY